MDSVRDWLSAVPTSHVIVGSVVAVGAFAYHIMKSPSGRVPDMDDNRHGGLLVAKVLKEHNVKFLFTLCGGHISTILIGCKQAGIKVVDTRHEVTTVFAADAVSRLTGVPGVAAVTAGPGVTNTITAIKNAQLAQSPLILLGGAAGTLLKGRGALQDVDQISLMKSICKWSVTIERVADIIPTLRKAFQVAQSGVPGPVFVEFPIDILYPYATVHREIVSKGSGKGFVPNIVNWYLTRHVNNLFAGGFEEVDASPLPVSYPKATQSQVEKAANLIRKAKKPVLLVGSQATLLATEANQVADAVKAIGVPSFLAGMARGLLGKGHPVWFRQRRSEALKEADLIILAGVPCDFRLNYGRSLGRKAKIITINRSKEDLTKNQDLFWKSDLSVLGDPGSFLLDLQHVLQGHDNQVWSDWSQTLRTRDDAKEAENAEKAGEKVDRDLNPLQVAFQMEKALDENSYLIADGGDFVATCAYTVCPRGPLRWLDPGVFGTLGVGAGFALAAKLVDPSAKVWIIYGDGSAGYSVNEFDTFTRFGLSIIAVVGNDACWSQIAREQVVMFGDDVGCPLAHTDYHVVAKGFGGDGLVVKGDLSSQEIADAFQKAKSLAKDGKSVLMNVYIGKSDFRKGSISV